MNKFFGTFIFSILFLSCSSDLDFDQVNDLKIEPVVVANLAYFDVPAAEFVTNGIENTVSGDLVDFEVFQDSFFDTSLTKVDFFFEFNNTINRAYRINLVLLDANNSPLYTIPFDVPAYSGTQNLVTKTVTFQNGQISILKNTSKIAFVVRMLPGPGLSESSLGSLKLRSSATLYFLFQ